MRVFLEKNGGDNSPIVPYLAKVEIATTTPNLNVAFHVPVYLRHIRDKTIYHAEVCGFHVEAHTAEEITPGIENLLPYLVNAARLPTYVFVARHSHHLYPVYTVGEEVFATTPGGPVFRHIELAKVREYLTEYLRTTGDLWRPGNIDRLHVRGVHSKSLALVRPVFYLKKRAQHPKDNEFWAPVFPSDDGDSIYTYAASARREEVVNCGHEVLHLRAQVAQTLIAAKRLQEELDLRVDRVMQPYWQRVAAILTPLPCQLVYSNIRLEVYQNREDRLAVEHRHNDENRVSLYFGRDANDLRDRTAQDFVRRGLIYDSAALRFER
jgi:hypothetical protein